MACGRDTRLPALGGLGDRVTVSGGVSPSLASFRSSSVGTTTSGAGIESILETRCGRSGVFSLFADSEPCSLQIRLELSTLHQCDNRSVEDRHQSSYPESPSPSENQRSMTGPSSIVLLDGSNMTSRATTSREPHTTIPTGIAPRTGAAIGFGLRDPVQARSDIRTCGDSFAREPTGLVSQFRFHANRPPSVRFLSLRDSLRFRRIVASNTPG